VPVDWSKYPPDWKKIAKAVKEAAGWKCAPPEPGLPGCGKQCRTPDVPFRKGHPTRGHKFTLTVAHLNHDPMDCRPENLRPLCAPCHIRYDARMKADKLKSRRMEVS
jgi:hypothetical protein